MQMFYERWEKCLILIICLLGNLAYIYTIKDGRKVKFFAYWVILHID